MRLSRRALLQVAVSGIISGGVLGLTALGRAEDLVRPPGAVAEPDFLALCARCQRCLDACAPLAIHPATIVSGLANLGTPVLETNKCIVCMECIRACPTGALARIPKDEVRIGTAVINQETCVAWLKTQRCRECEKSCPLKAVTMKGGRFPEIVADKCNGCGICMRRCPTEPKSITISPEGATRAERPTERILLELPDRVGPYEIEPPPYLTRLSDRLRKLAEVHLNLK